MFARSAAQSILQKHIDNQARPFKIPTEVSAEYQAQIKGTIPLPDRDPKTGTYREIWKDVRPCHMRDCEAQQIVAAAITHRIIMDVGDLPKDEGTEE